MRGRVYDSGHFSVKSAQFQNEFMWNIQEKRSLYIHGRVKIYRGRHVVCLSVCKYYSFSTGNSSQHCHENPEVEVVYGN